MDLSALNPQVGTYQHRLEMGNYAWRKLLEAVRDEAKKSEAQLHEPEVAGSVEVQPSHGPETGSESA